MAIDFKINQVIQPSQFKQLLDDSGLGQHHPVEDESCMAGMLENSNLIISAWDNERLIAIARSITNFHYACYLSDLAVSQSYQRLGIGKQLQVMTQEQLGPRCCKLILIAAPAANVYYEHIGFSNNPRCWVLERDEEI